MKANLLQSHTKDTRVTVMTVTLGYHVLKTFVMLITISTYTTQVSRNGYPNLCGQRLKLEMIKSWLKATPM